MNPAELDRLARLAGLPIPGDTPTPDTNRPINQPGAPGRNTGHGHVFPRPDGVRARCGGPSLCTKCRADAARKAAAEQSATDEVAALRAFVGAFDEWEAAQPGQHTELYMALRRARTALDTLPRVDDAPAPAEGEIRRDQPIESVRLARRPAYLQGDLGRTRTTGPIDLGDDPDGDCDGAW